MKNIIKIISVLTAIIVLCNIYTVNRTAYYNAHPEKRYYVSITYMAANYNFVYDDPDFFCYIRMNDYEENTLSVGHGYFDDERKEVRIFPFEQYILWDYVNYVIRPMKDDEDAPKTDKKMYVRLYCYSLDNEAQGLSHERKEINRTVGNSMMIQLYALIALTMLYSRTILPPVLLFYILLAVPVFFISRNYIMLQEGFKSNLKRLCGAAGPELRFAVLTSAALLAFNAVYIHSTLFTALYKDDSISNRYVTWHLGGVNLWLALILHAAETAFVVVIFKEKRIRNAISYIIPSLLLLAGQCIYFGIYEKDLFYFAKKMNLFWFFVDQRMPYFRLLYFTVFFAAGLVLYFIFGLIAGRGTERLFRRAMAFSAVNALHICLASWLLVYGWGVLY